LFGTDHRDRDVKGIGIVSDPSSVCKLLIFRIGFAGSSGSGIGDDAIMTRNSFLIPVKMQNQKTH